MKKDTAPAADGTYTLTGRATRSHPLLPAIPATLFAVLAADQLRPLPQKSPLLGLSFALPAALLLSLTVRLAVRRYSFMLRIEPEQVVYQSAPFNRKTYTYRDITGCSREVRHSAHAANRVEIAYFSFHTTDGQDIAFAYDHKNPEECKAIRLLQKRIEAENAR